MKKQMVFPVIVVSLFTLLTGCASTSLVGTWSEPKYKTKIQKILVVGLSQNESIKRTYESTLSESIRAAGAQAEPAGSLLPAATETTADAIKAAIAGKGYDTVLVTRLVSRVQEERYVPGTPYPIPHSYYYGFHDYYSNVYPTVYSPGYLVNDTIVNLETNIYEVNEGKLIWAVVSETFNPDDINKEIKTLSEVLVTRLKKDGLL